MGVWGLSALLLVGVLGLGSLEQTPALTEVEKLKLEKAELMTALAEVMKDRAQWRLNFGECVAQLGKNEATGAEKMALEYGKAVVDAILKAYPGYTVNANGELVPVQKER